MILSRGIDGTFFTLLGVSFLIGGLRRLRASRLAKAEGKKVAAYGAAAKGNTFLNHCGVTNADIVCVYDRSREKQNHLLPGSHIPILAPERIGETRPDYLVILPWNLATEISGQMAKIRGWGGQFVTAIPQIRIF